MVWWLTLAYLAMLVRYSYAAGAPQIPMKLSEIGDFLAGAFAPIAFLWLVYGYLMQASELRLQRQSLALQVHELQNMVGAAKAQAQAASVQAAIARQDFETRRDGRFRSEKPDINVEFLSGMLEGTGHLSRFVVSNYGPQVESFELGVMSVGWELVKATYEPGPLRVGKSFEVDCLTRGDWQKLPVSLIATMSTSSGRHYQHTTTFLGSKAIERVTKAEPN